MRATLLKETIKKLFPTKRTIAIEGSPGGGKTTIVQEVAKELGVGYIEKHMPCLLYTSPSPRDLSTSRMPSSA